MNDHRPNDLWLFRDGVCLQGIVVIRVGLGLIYVSHGTLYRMSVGGNWRVGRGFQERLTTGACNSACTMRGLLLIPIREEPVLFHVMAEASVCKEGALDVL